MWSISWILQATKILSLSLFLFLSLSFSPYFFLPPLSPSLFLTLSPLSLSFPFIQREDPKLKLFENNFKIQIFGFNKHRVSSKLIDFLIKHIFLNPNCCLYSSNFTSREE